MSGLSKSANRDKFGSIEVGRWGRRSARRFPPHRQHHV